MKQIFILIFLLITFSSIGQNADRYPLKDVKIKIGLELFDISLGDTKEYVESYFFNIKQSDFYKTLISKDNREFSLQHLSFSSCGSLDVIEVRFSSWILETKLVFDEGILKYVLINNYLNLWAVDSFNLGIQLADKSSSDYSVYNSIFCPKNFELLYEGDGGHIRIVEYSDFLIIINQRICSGCNQFEIIDKEFSISNIYDTDLNNYTNSNNPCSKINMRWILSLPNFREIAHRTFLDEQIIPYEIKQADDLFYTGSIEKAERKYNELLKNNSKHQEYIKKQLGKLKHTRTVWNNTNLGKAIKANQSLENIIYVDVSEKNIYCVPDYIVKATNLKTLNLAGNQALQQLPKNFYQLKRLTSLDISATGFKTFPTEILALSQLTKLSNDSNPHLLENYQFPLICNSLRKLQRLSIKNNRLCCLPSEIQQLTSLKELNVAGNYCFAKEELPEAIKNNMYLKIIDTY